MRLKGAVFLSGCGCLLALSFFVVTSGNSEDDEWIDPFDMLNFDAAAENMKKPAEGSSYSNVPTKRREHSPDSSLATRCPDLAQCTNQVNKLQTEIEEYKSQQSCSSQQPNCHAVFKRFLSKLLKEIEKLGLPSAVNTNEHYDAEVKLSRQKVAEIQKFLSDEAWSTGAMDDALSQILVNFKLHDYEAWKWRFEDTFGVDLGTVIMVFVLVLIIVLIICTEMWCTVSWFVQFKRMFAICFFISIVWNWFYLYKIAFAEHQANMVKMEHVNEKCTGVTKIDWKDNLREWFRTTWTLQDDPCKQYYEVLFVNPILLVPPTKPITRTITTFITDPMKQIGQGISEFLRALLKDLPLQLQIPVLLTIVLSILVFVYISAQAAIHQVALMPLRGRRGDPPPALQQPNNPALREPAREEKRDQWAGGDANHDPAPRHHAVQGGNPVNQTANRPNEERPEICQRRPNRPREEQRRVHVETLRNADLYSGDETDSVQGATTEEPNEQQSIDGPLVHMKKEEEKTPVPNRPREEQRKVHVGSLCDADLYRGDETENVQGATAEEPNEQQSIDGPLVHMKIEEKKTPVPNSTEPKPSQPVPKEQTAESTSVDVAASGDNRRDPVAASTPVMSLSSIEKHVETLRTPVQETMH